VVESRSQGGIRYGRLPSGSHTRALNYKTRLGRGFATAYERCIIELDRESRVGTGDPIRAAMDETDRYSSLLRFIRETKMEGGVDTIVARLKIEHYKKLLETDTDETRRKIVMRLLAEEHAKLVEAISKAIVQRS
jgi:hypothetical protein